MKNTIEKINGRWVVNKKLITECYGFEVDFFLAFLRFMQYPQDEKQTKSLVINKKDFNYKFKHL